MLYGWKISVNMLIESIWLAFLNVFEIKKYKAEDWEKIDDCTPF